MLDKDMIQLLFQDINNELSKIGIKGEILIVGGAVMCMVYQSRKTTKDVDGIFAPSTQLRDIISQVGLNHGLESDWLNDGAKGFISQNINKNELISFSNLKVYFPDDDYMLAMKCLSARSDSFDGEDIEFLISKLGLTSLSEIEDIIYKYYPKKQVSQKTYYFIEEILERLKK